LSGKTDEFYLNVCFSKNVELMEQNNKAIAVDINENNVAYGSTEGIENFKTKERAIRTAYFLKRRRIQLRLGSRGENLMKKYKERERKRIEDIYHKLAGQDSGKSQKGGCNNNSSGETQEHKKENQILKGGQRKIA
jgi:putative transposase